MSNRVEPSQLRSRLPIGPDPGRSQHAYYRPTATHGEWKGSANGRWRDRAILFGLWLLIMLVAIAIGFRFLEETDPSKMRSVRAEALAGMDSLPARTPSMVRPDYAAVDDAFDDPLPEAASRGVPAATAVAAMPPERPLPPAAIREALAAARSAREGFADAMEPRPDAVKTRQAPSLPNAEPGSPVMPVRPAMPAQVREAGTDTAASLAQAASPARRAPALRGAAAITDTAEQKRAPACSDALQAMQLCNVAVR
nr:hypothetical protein [uncultured Noviherbaspirillum sp.]